MQKKRFLLGLLSGLLLALSFPPYPFFLFSFIAFIPLFNSFQYVKKKWWLIYLTFFIYHYATNWWISSWQKDTDPYLFVSGFAVALVHPLLFMFPFAIQNVIARRLGWKSSIALFPFLWVAFEWLHSLGELAYPWLTIGYTQVYNHIWIQVADIGGVWFVSFLIVLCNVFIYFAIEEYKEHQTIGKKLIFKSKYIYLFLITFLLPYAYGIFKVNEFSFEKVVHKENKIRVGIIQPNINPWRKWETDALTQVKIHKHIQDSLASAVPNIDLFVWSETAITMLSLDINAEHKFDAFYEILPQNSSLLTGFADFKFLNPNEKPSFTTKYLFGDSSKPYETYNSILLLNPNRTFQIYHKNRLTPFGEHIPYSQVLGFAKSFLEWNVGISSWAKGTEQNVLSFENQRTKCLIAPIICIESIYPDYCRNFINKGAEVITIITNDGWYDHTFGPTQHFLIATVRAIETRRFVVRCANTGISGTISPDGKTLYKAPQYQQVGIAADIAKLDYKTTYTMLGDFVPYTSILITIVALFYSILKKRKH